MYQRKLALEPLEDRALLSASAADALLGSLAAFESGNKGDAGSPVAKIGSDLAGLYEAYDADGLVSWSSTANAVTNEASLMEVDLTSKRVLIDVSSVASDPSGLRTDLADLGFSETGVYGRMVSGWLPVSQLDELSVLPSLLTASPVLTPQTSVGSVTSQGDAAMDADIARSTYGVDGSGVKVGILSDSFDALGRYATDVVTGDLPAGVEVLSDYIGSDEGRAMAQIIYDVAPGASLAFATAFGGQASFADNILALAAAGCTVITDDVYYFAEPFFQDGVIAQAVNTVASQGVSYFSSAGNGARASYQSDFAAGSTFANGQISVSTDLMNKIYNAPPRFYGGVAMDFDPGTGVNNYQLFRVDPYETIRLILQWDQPFASVSGVGAANDVDVYVLNAARTQVLGGSAENNFGGDPIEEVWFTNVGQTVQWFNLMIVSRTTTTLPGFVKYINYGDDMARVAFATNSGTSVGHPNTVGAAAVGAAYYANTPRFGVSLPMLESFSSPGGTPILFDASGTRLATPLDLYKTDFVAPDGVITTVSGFGTFYGTSAAAPHAAGVAALLLDFDNTLTPAEVYADLKSTAVAMANPFGSGYNYAAGAGLIQADAALAALTGGGGTTEGTTTVVTTDHPAGSVYGEALVFTVTVSASSEGASPTGSVQLVIDGSSYGSSVTLTDGQGSITVASLGAGNHTVGAVYTSDDPDNFPGSVSPDLSIVVTRAPLTIKAEDKQMYVGDPLPTFTAKYEYFVNDDTVAGLTTPSEFSTNAPAVLPAGTYTITVNGATSPNYEISFLPGSLTVYAVQDVVSLKADPLDPTKTALYVLGTDANDVIQLTSVSGGVAVKMGGKSRGTFYPTSRIIVHGWGGNDSITVASTVTLPAWLYGDSGNDTLSGGGGPNILFGAAGADKLSGGKGRSLLIGGDGADSINGGAGETLMIGGNTTLDANDVALLAILNEWNSSAARTTRTSHITGASGGLNGACFFNATTVRDDGANDKLVGGAAMDLFFKSVGDTISKRKSNETIFSV